MVYSFSSMILEARSLKSRSQQDYLLSGNLSRDAIPCPSLGCQYCQNLLYSLVSRSIILAYCFVITWPSPLVRLSLYLFLSNKDIKSTQNYCLEEHISIFTLKAHPMFKLQTSFWFVLIIKIVNGNFIFLS